MGRKTEPTDWRDHARKLAILSPLAAAGMSLGVFAACGYLFSGRLPFEVVPLVYAFNALIAVSGAAVAGLLERATLANRLIASFGFGCFGLLTYFAVLCSGIAIIESAGI